jgi:hypothetical protein
MKCERCGDLKDCETFNGVPLCEPCVVNVITEWSIKRREFGEFTAS